MQGKRILGWTLLVVGFMLASPAWAAGAVHEVYPTGDLALDGDLIQAAIDGAAPGDTVLLKAGTFVVGKFVDDDYTVVTSPGRQMENYLTRVWTNPPLHYYFMGLFGPPELTNADGQVAQVIHLNKAITVRGEEGTVISAPQSMAFLVGTLDAGAVISDLVFDDVYIGVHAVTAGVTVENCTFQDVPWAVLMWVDDYSAYPGYPDDLTARAGCVVSGNTFNSCCYPVHLRGSEVEIQDNEILNPALDVTDYMGVDLGGMVEFFAPGGYLYDVRDDYHVEMCRNNVVADNYMVNLYNGVSHHGEGGEHLTNVVRGNSILECLRPYAIYGYAGRVDDGHVIETNTITVPSLGVFGILVQGRVPGNTLNVAVRGNDITFAGGRGIWTYGTLDCSLEGNVISGTGIQAILAHTTSGLTMRDNEISADTTGSLTAQYWNYGATVAGNRYSGSADWGGIYLESCFDGVVQGNVIENLVTGLPNVGHITLYKSENLEIVGNELEEVSGGLAGMRIVYGGSNTVLDNDMSNSGFPGWNKKHPDGPGCVELYGTSGNLVDGLRLPPGTKICEQVWDNSDDLSTPEYDGDNVIVGWDKCPDIADLIRENRPEKCDLGEDVKQDPPGL